MAQGRLRLFGRFEVEADGAARAALQARKVQELMSYLLLNRKRPVNREKLADLLWPDVDGQRSRKYLRQTLWHLRKAENCWRSQQRLFTIDQDWIKVNPHLGIWVDVFEFDRAYEHSMNVQSGKLPDDARGVLAEAVDLYRGDLLDGWYYDWCLHHQDVYRSMYLLILDKLMIDAEECGNWEIGLTYGRRALEQDRANERTHRRMMRLHCLAGNRIEALRQFDLCAQSLHDELSVEPEADTVKFYQSIRDNELAELGGFERGTTEPMVADELTQTELGQTLRRLQRDIGRCIEALEQR